LIFSLALLLGLAILTFFGLRNMRQEQEFRRLEYQPPAVQIIEPQNGYTVPTGRIVPVTARIAFSRLSPVKIVEWWWDGILLESHPLEPVEGAALDFATYDLVVPAEGNHLLLPGW